MKILLKLKHWQMFLLMVGPVILVKMLSIFASPNFYLRATPLVTAWFYVITIFWLQSLMEFLEDNPVNPVYKPNTLFRIVCFVVVVTQISLATIQSMHGLLPILQILSPLILLFLIYLSIRVGRLIKMNEVGKEVTFINYFETSFFLLISPIGIWIIQPKINDLSKS